MRKLTHYELRTLIKNEINNMQLNAMGSMFIQYVETRAKDILQYCEEYKSLEPLED